jgi:hypothetical protein
MGVYELSGAGSVKTGRTLYTSMNAGNQFGAMVPIASASESTFSGFTNIPTTYQDLYVVGSVLSDATRTATSLWLRLNNDSATNYSVTQLDGNGSSASSSRAANNTIIGLNFGLVSGNPAVFEMWILNYANTSTLKTVLIRSANDNNGSGTTSLMVGLYRSTSVVSAINLLYPGGNSQTANTTATLYGIRAVSS